MVGDVVRKELQAVAAKSELVGQVRTLVGWLGAGRRLTQTGRITLADARTLVDLLATGDTIDPKIGDRVFRTKSSEELGGLNLVLEWAKAARLVRIVHGRLVPVKKNAPLLGRPLDLWLALWEALPGIGGALLPEGWFESLLRLEYADGVAVLLAELHGAGGGLSAGRAQAAVWDALSVRYILDRLTEEQLRRARSVCDHDVDRVLRALVLLGAAQAVGGAGDAVELTPLGRFGMARLRGEPEPGEPVYEITVVLAEAQDPPVWRRLLVPAAMPLGRLHGVIQDAMGWQRSHLHSFHAAGVDYGRPGAELGFADEDGTVLGAVAVGGRLEYTYDFGDSWEHEITVERELTAEAGVRYPRCTAGEGACPPEDCGGLPGYQDLRETLADPDDEEHEAMLEWLGLQSASQFDPAAFDLDAANRRLAGQPSRSTTRD